ncbi:MAG: hypothetical protein UY77_C0034G0015 [Candidatus Uhrbacteria bacterium GW2011_GWA2_53_10]|uniref:Uncharacterized protein n=1 Tax=Candidatus Uhrbacteria bacterium GW2011_GWA2_53_10 TaxID=1618980 RepID=A0A0G1XMR1_9BACT|nr:MAG: hypothetical protein UY77_C0034G0015 [Candidatus Uhrbacteria bacterium GW2011_GWA2_53_10]
MQWWVAWMVVGMMACQIPERPDMSWSPPRIQVELQGIMQVDYHLSLEEMLQACPLEWIGPLEGKFPVFGTGVKTRPFLVVRALDTMRLSDLLWWLDMHELEPARIEHLLALARAFHEEPLPVPIVAFGSRWEEPGTNDVHVPSLDGPLEMYGPGRFYRSGKLPWEGEESRLLDVMRLASDEPVNREVRFLALRRPDWHRIRHVRPVIAGQ